MGKGMSQRHLGAAGRAGRVWPPGYWDSQVTLSSDPLKYAEIQGGSPGLFLTSLLKPETLVTSQLGPRFLCLKKMGVWVSPAPTLQVVVKTAQARRC